MPKIFISYRRKDSAPFVGRIYERLVREFGESNIFYDIENIPKGKNFKDVLRHNVTSCDVLLAMIGPQWASITDANGNKRLFDDNDYVRYEVDTALRRIPNVTVIPVLISDADMPSKTYLPSVLQPLTELNAIKVRNDPDFRRDMDDLIKSIKPTRSRISVGLVLVAVLILAVIGFGIFAPQLFQSVAAASTTTQTPTTVVPSLTDQPTFTLMPIDEPSLTPLPHSETSSRTDAAIPIPTNPLPAVSISVPTVVLPNTTILVTTWQNAHCIFTPNDGNIPFGFDTSTGNIQYSIKHKTGTIVSIVCEDNQGRHAENQFVVSSAAILTTTITNTLEESRTPTIITALPTATVTRVLPTQTLSTKSYPCDGQIIFTTGAMLNEVRTLPQQNSSPRPLIAQGAHVLIINKQKANGGEWYEIIYSNGSNTGWISLKYVTATSNCP